MVRRSLPNSGLAAERAWHTEESRGGTGCSSFHGVALGTVYPAWSHAMPPEPVQPSDLALIATIRGVVAFALTWGVLSIAAWLILPRLTGSEMEWLVPATAAMFFVLAIGVGWLEYRRALRSFARGRR